MHILVVIRIIKMNWRKMWKKKICKKFDTEGGCIEVECIANYKMLSTRQYSVLICSKNSQADYYNLEMI